MVFSGETTTESLIAGPPVAFALDLTMAPVALLRTTQEFTASVQVQARVDELPLEISPGVAVKVQELGPAVPRPQVSPTLEQPPVFAPGPPTITQLWFWHSRWESFGQPELQAGSELQLGPEPALFTQACWTASHTPWKPGLPGPSGSLPQSAEVLQRLAPAPLTEMQALLKHSEWVVGGVMVELKVAVQDLLAFMVTPEFAEVPEQSPLQPAKVEPDAAAAVKVTAVAGLYGSVQSEPQEMPPGFEVTVPLPVPVFATVRV